MSRKIKFRAWGVYVHKYYYNAEHTYDFMCMGDGCYSQSFGTVLDDERFIVEQYTGLKDKNGKEIYEGDIVGIYQEYCNLEGSKTWEELEPWGQVVYEDNKARFGICGDSPYEGEDKQFFDLVEGLEVIGNIHEPPKDFSPEHLKRMDVSIIKGVEE